MLYASKNAMGENRQQPGFTLLEIVFVLVLMGVFTACFAIKPFKSKDDVIYGTKVILSEAVFLARLHSMASGLPNVSKDPIILSLTKEKELEVRRSQNFWEKKYSKRLDSRISECKLVDFPWSCKSSDYTQNLFQAGKMPQEKVVFEEKFFLPFQLEFLLDGKECHITVDTNAQIQVYEKK
ncbi:MAG: type II secretion system GspH family protein [Puniceicoccales bacterium]|nr:type II secretion system GspH family protein [Puniceicoccales bacterium]